jgi:hypothetical protein
MRHAILCFRLLEATFAPRVANTNRFLQETESTIALLTKSSCYPMLYLFLAERAIDIRKKCFTYVLVDRVKNHSSDHYLKHKSGR